jgi:hypothetical protein
MRSESLGRRLPPGALFGLLAGVAIFEMVASWGMVVDRARAKDRGRAPSPRLDGCPR